MDSHKSSCLTSARLHEDMKCVRLLFVCWCSSILAVSGCLRVDGYSCVSAYWNTVSCVLNITGNPAEQSIYSLKFICSGKGISCPLTVMNHSYSCVCKLKNGSRTFISYDEYQIQLCNKSGCNPITEQFEPSQNIQLTPPHKPEVRQLPETVNITWESGYEAHRYLDGVLDYELLLQTSQTKESKILRLNSRKESASIQTFNLKPDATYCVKVRSKPPKNDYNGTWSQWSPSTCWRNEAEASSEQDNILVTLTKSLAPVCVAVGVLLFVFYSPAARMKIKTLSHTPSPAPFFKPLYQQYEGNLQEWLSPKGTCVLTSKAEEMLTGDVVIVVPKPVTKDPEESQDFHNPPITQLQFTQCQSSYVGLPGVHEPSPPLTTICPGETSYTQLPCAVWGISFGEVEVVSPPPKDIFNISTVDSGCSCEDLTQSPECSLPSSPVVDSPPPCSCTDYCILNKTAEGFAPVLVSKGGSLNVPSDSLQEEKI